MGAYGLQLLQSILKCLRFSVLFHDSSFRGRTNCSISGSTDLRSVFASPASNKTEGQVGLDSNVERVDEESNPSDKKHTSLWAVCVPETVINSN